MQPRLHCSLVAAVLFFAASAYAAPPQAWSDEFDRPGLIGRVFALGEYQGELVAGGLPLLGDGETSFGLCARFDGARWRKLGTGISGGGSLPDPYEVRATAEFQGSLIVGGRFCCAGSVPVQGVARWDGAQWHALGSGIPGIVYALAEYQGELYAAGEFLSAGGVPVENIARWNGSQWAEVGGGLDKSFDPSVLALQVGPDDRLYASGEFDTAGSVTMANNVAVWDGASWSALGGGLPGPLNGLVWDLEFFQGELYAGGNFDLVPGGQNQQKVAVWDGASWTAVGNFPDSSIGTHVITLSVLGSNLYAGGNIVDADGAPAERFARFDGNQWSFAGGVSGASQITGIWASTVHAGKLVVGGEFSRAGTSQAAGQAVVANSVAAFDGVGTWDSVGVGRGMNAAVYDGVAWNGGVVAVGGFTEAGSQFVGGPSLWAGPVFYDGSDWSSLGVFNNASRSAIVWNGDLIVGGDFTVVDGQPIAGVAGYDGSQWSGFGTGAAGDALAVYQGELYAGGLGGVKRWNGSAWESFAPTLFGQVVDMHVHQGVLYIGGSLNSDDHLVSWDGTTQQTLGGGTNGTVYCFESFEGDLLVGGTFSSAGGVSVNSLARWNGSSFSAFPGITGTLVQSMTLFQDELHASGNLIVPGLPPNKYIARWDGADWQALGSGTDAQASLLVPDEVGGHLYAGGAMQAADGVPSWYFARWDLNPLEVGTPLCFGDGSGGACPCGNEEVGGGCVNSSLSGSALRGFGSDSVSAGDLVLRASDALPGQPGLFFQGDVALNGGDGVVFGDGLRCCGASVVRLEVVLPDATGEAATSVDVAARGGASVDETKCYQLWYRDPAGSPCGFGFNLSNALAITWAP